MNLVLYASNNPGAPRFLRVLIRRAMQARRERRTRVLLGKLPDHVKRDIGMPADVASSYESGRLRSMVFHMW